MPYSLWLRIKNPNLRGRKLGSQFMPYMPALPLGRVKKFIRSGQVSWLTASYLPRLPGQSPVAEANGPRLRVQGSWEVFPIFRLAPYALRLAPHVAFVPITVAGQRWILTTFPSRSCYFEKVPSPSFTAHGASLIAPAPLRLTPDALTIFLRLAPHNIHTSRKNCQIISPSGIYESLRRPFSRRPSPK
jgi:hypothetical protein